MARPGSTTAWRVLALRWMALVVISVLALQVFFALRITLMKGLDVESTAFQRSEYWRLVVLGHRGWSQAWRAYGQLGDPLKRAVVASEDAGFSDHQGFEWDAIEKAWGRNQRALERADRLQQVAEQRAARARTTRGDLVAARPVQARIVGGSTISQQLAKNLFLSGERTVLRKAQEFVLTALLEGLLDKQRILEIYLNSVEWGEGVFGAQAAAQRYFHTDAARLTASQAAQLAVMLPAPKRFEKQAGSTYVAGRAATIAARMSAVDLP